MFSILNEIGNNSHFRTTAVVVASIGTSAFLYVLVAITGYLSFGNAVGGNVVAMCKFIPLFLPHTWVADNGQTNHQSPQPLAKPPSSFSSCSRTLSKSTLVELPSTQYSNGGRGGVPTPQIILHRDPVSYSHLLNPSQSLKVMAWVKHASQPLPQASLS